MKIIRSFALFFAELAFAATILAQTPAPVRTHAGLVQGTIENGITVYKAYRLPRHPSEICAGARHNHPSP